MDKKSVHGTKKQIQTVFNSKVKSKEIGDERRIVFVASSNKQDRHYETVDVASLRLPLKGGGYAVVGSLTEDGIETVDIPLMLNHSGDVRDIIGSVRKAYFKNNELIFEAGISSREIAQEMMTLIEEEHLSNSFSITMSDFDYNFDTETISNAEIIEVSLVYRGSNKEARLLVVKSLMEKQMDEKDKKIADLEAKLAEKETLETTTVETPENEELKEKSENPTPEVEETEAPVEVPAEEEPAEKIDEETKEEPKEKTTMDKKIAKDSVKEKAETPVQSFKSGDYLKSKEAMVDFKNIVLKHHRGSNDAIMREWSENLKAKAIAGDSIMPSQIENIFFKAWVDNPGILGTFRTLNAKNAAVYAMTTEDVAKGHKKGETKANQTITAVRRDLKGLGIYKKLPIDLQDLYDDETGELLAFRVEELAARVANAIAVGALIGQGTGDTATLQGTRGLNPMLTDIKAASGYGVNVATKVTGLATDGNYELAVRALGAVKDEKNAGKVLVVPTGFMTDMRLAKSSSDGHLILPVGADIAALLGAKQIFEIDELVGQTVKAIAYANQSYVLVGESAATVRTDFDTTKNQDIMLVERYVGGSQQGYKTLAGVFAAGDESES